MNTIKRNYVYIGSFDIGKKNFAYCIEKFDLNKLRDLSSQVKKKRNVCSPTSEFVKDVIPQFLTAGETVFSCVIDLRDDEDSNKYDIITRENIIDHLEANVGMWKHCDYIIIEQQFFRKFSRGGKVTTQANIDAIKISEGVLMWFKTTFPFIKTTFITSEGKTHALGAPKTLSKKERKDWTIGYAYYAYNHRGDDEMCKVWNVSKAIYKKRLTSEEKRAEFKDAFHSDVNYVNFLVKCVVDKRQKLDDISDSMLQAIFFVIKNYEEIIQI